MTPEQARRLDGIVRTLDRIAARLEGDDASPAPRKRAGAGGLIRTAATRTPADYEAIPAHHVAPTVRRAVERMIDHVMRDLDLPELGVLWFKLTDAKAKRLDALLGKLAAQTGTDYQPGAFFEIDTPVAGLMKFAREGTIWLRADLTPVQAAFVAAHEARHVWQHRHGRIQPRVADASWTVKQAEEDADDYAARAMPKALA